jgi:hypothetical protein
MKDTMQQAREAAEKKQQTTYVFRAVGLNGHETSWFNFTGEPNSPRDELVATFVPTPP